MQYTLVSDPVSYMIAGLFIVLYLGLFWLNIRFLRSTKRENEQLVSGAEAINESMRSLDRTLDKALGQ